MTSAAHSALITRRHWGDTALGMKEAAELKRGISFTATLRGRMFCFHTTWGLFSPRSIDAGSQMLVESLDLRSDHTTLDLGCGYGAIGIPVAHCCPDGYVHMVDKDFVAVAHAQRNAEANGLRNCLVYPSNGLGAVPAELRFDNIVSNVPANVGAEMLYILLSDARVHLKTGGRIYVVCISGLRRFIQRHLQEVFGNYTKLRQGGTYTVATAEKLSRGPTSSPELAGRA